MFGIAVEIWVIVGLGVLGLILLMSWLASLYRKAGPHEALIVYGFGGTHVVVGHGKVVLPMVQVCRELSLELMSFDVAPQQDLYTKQGVAVTVEAVAQIKVTSDHESILTASEQFLTKTPDQREGLIRLVMEGHLRGIIGQLTVEEIVKQPEMVSDRMRSTCADDMNKMGLEVISFTIKEVRDKNEYITNMGRPDVARIKRDADVAAAEADRDTAIKRALAQRESAVARAQADQDRVQAETASLAKQAEAQRDLEVKKAQYLEVTKRQQAQADKAYDIQTNIMQQQVVAEQVKVQQVEKEQQVKVQEAEIARREKELIATVLKQAEIERQRIETLTFDLCLLQHGRDQFFLAARDLRFLYFHLLFFLDLLHLHLLSDDLLLHDVGLYVIGLIGLRLLPLGDFEELCPLDFEITLRLGLFRQGKRLG